MRKHFEIVRCRGDRYSWVLVGTADGRRRVLARGGRDYGSRGRVHRAICALQEDIGDAEILDATCDVDLPATSFEIGPYATPLFVGVDSRGPYGSASRHNSSGRGRGRRAEVEMIEVVAVDVEEADAAAADLEMIEVVAVDVEEVDAAAADSATGAPATPAKGRRR